MENDLSVLTRLELAKDWVRDAGNFLKENILVIKYVAREISKEDLEEVLKEVLAKEEVEEKYVRDFLNCSMIDRNSKNFEIDKIMLIYKYGSKKARKIAVDEKLKMI